MMHLFTTIPPFLCVFISVCNAHCYLQMYMTKLRYVDLTHTRTTPAMVKELASALGCRVFGEHEHVIAADSTIVLSGRRENSRGATVHSGRRKSHRDHHGHSARDSARDSARESGRDSARELAREARREKHAEKGESRKIWLCM